ncbi:beta-fructosidase [Ditylenchus destructor]|uniref:beta-fructofuranosidase n=1 Tax=Ditylenchus destructor TaxID=166010 RepID=A0AAD4QYD4_9BILA|nr:beta-fructosidase [Ditylenchus destructor]
MAKFKRKTLAYGAIGAGVAVIAVGLLVWLIVSLRNNSSAPDNNQTSVAVENKNGTVMHVWLKTTNTSSKARLLSSEQFNVDQDNSNISRTNILETSQTIEFEFHEIRDFGSANFWWFRNETIVSYMYVFEPKEVLEKGIRIAYISPEAQIPDVPDGYHFRPPLGWMNDPNGFSKVGDTYHLFYQHYPHRPQWQSMHWGHAASKDLVNWVHLPIFLRPNPSVALEHGGGGGAFSGSAIPLGQTGIQIFYTDDISDKEPKKEEQYTGISSDGVQLNHGSLERLGIEQPKGYNLTSDFRDPAIFVGPNGDYQMVLGSQANESGVILHYRRNDRRWEFQDILWLDNRLGMTVAECPGVLPVGGGPGDESTLWALIYAQLNGQDPRTGKRNLTPVIVGEFRSGHGFVKRFEKPELDFGTSAYAFQGFHGPDGTIIIGGG